MKIGIDLDGVCRDFVDAMNAAFALAYPQLAHKIRPQNDYSFDNWPFEEAGIDPWDFMKEHPKAIFSLASPIPGAIEAAGEIVRNLEASGHEIIVCSHQEPSIACYTWLWLYINRFPASKVIFVEKSTEKWKYVDIMIDDSPHVLAAKPKGKYSFKVNHPYNINSSCDWSIDHLREFLPIFEKNF